MIRPIGWLSNRSDQAGMFIAVGTVAATFQRTLMPRNNADQAVITGLSMALSYQIASLVNDGIEALAAVVLAVRSRRPGANVSDAELRTVSLAFSAAGLLTGLGLQKLFSQRDDESLLPAVGRTSGFFLASASFAGGAARALELAAAEIDQRQERLNVSDLPLSIIGGMLFATARDYQRRQREAQFDTGRPRHFSPVLSLPLGVGVGLILAGFGIGNRLLARRIGTTLDQFLPGGDRLWSPIGRVTTLGLLAGGIVALAQWVYSAIESKSEKIEPAYEKPPTSELVTAGRGSHVDWSTLGFKGRRFVATVLSSTQIEEVMKESAKDPIRVYVGLDSAPNPEERVRLAIDEMERTGAFRRKLIMAASPTGTGQVHYGAIGSTEYFSRGDCATVAVQYSKRPSPLSLDRIWLGRKQFRLLLSAIRRKLYGMAPGERPRLVVFGESLGAHTSQDPFLHTGTQGLVDGGIDGALWIGTPHLSQWKRQIHDTDRPDVDPSLVGEFHGQEDLDALSASARKQMRYFLLTNGNDPVGYFGPELLIQRPTWLGEPESRPPGVPGGQRWVPPLTFLHTLVDMKNALNIVPGEFVATGHDYRANLARFVRAAFDLEASDEQLERVEQALQENEVRRSKRIASSGEQRAASGEGQVAPRAE